MALSERAFVSFLVSVFLMSGIAVLAYIGFFSDNFLTMPTSLKAITFAVVFLTLFLLIFFLSNLKRVSSKKKKKAAVGPPGFALPQDGLLAMASRLSSPGEAGIDETSRHDVIYEKNGVPYINSGMVSHDKNLRKLDGNFIKLVESVKGVHSLTPSVP